MIPKSIQDALNQCVVGDIVWVTNGVYGTGGAAVFGAMKNRIALTNAVKSGSPNGAADAAYSFGYQYDQVGNRLHEDRGQMDLDGSFNNLNQITALDWYGKLDVLGTVGTSGVIVKVAG